MQKIFDFLTELSHNNNREWFNAHKEQYLRGTTLISGAQLFFKDWTSADTYYKGHKTLEYDSLPAEHYLVKKIEPFDSLAETPDSCMIADIREVTVGKLSPMKVCSGALKMVACPFEYAEDPDSLEIEGCPSDIQCAECKRKWLAKEVGK